MRYRFLFGLFLTLTLSHSFAQDRVFDKEQEYTKVGIDVFKQLQRTNPFYLDSTRLDLLYTVETYSDSFPPDQFKAYLQSDALDAERLEQQVPILYAYRTAFDKVFHELKTRSEERRVGKECRDQ